MPRDVTTPHDRPEDGGSPNWLQRGGFSIFFDVVVDDAGVETWRTRLYHEETGQETVVAGIGATRWPRWILGQLGVGRPPDLDSPGRDPTGGDPNPTAVHEVIVEVVDVRLVGRTRRGGDVETVRIEADMRIRGLAALERGVGAAVLDRAHRRAAHLTAPGPEATQSR